MKILNNKIEVREGALYAVIRYMTTEFDIKYIVYDILSERILNFDAYEKVCTWLFEYAISRYDCDFVKDIISLKNIINEHD